MVDITLVHYAGKATTNGVKPGHKTLVHRDAQHSFFSNCNELKNKKQGALIILLNQSTCLESRLKAKLLKSACQNSEGDGE